MLVWLFAYAFLLVWYILDFELNKVTLKPFELFHVFLHSVFLCLIAYVHLLYDQL